MSAPGSEHNQWSWLALVAGLLIFGMAQSHWGKVRTTSQGPELRVTLPVPAQILFAAGDRRLAANFIGFRVLVAETSRMKRDDYAVQAKLQQDLSRLNPAHEDNYYIAANILPWGGEIEAAEAVLKRAAEARPTDWLPQFHVGFIHFHFKREPAVGAEWLLAAAERAIDPQDRMGLQNIAAKWIERGYSVSAAAQLVAAMAKNAPPGGFRSYLQMRSQRLLMLAELRMAASRFRDEQGRPPAALSELMTYGYLQTLPRDPLGIGFRVSGAGEIEFEKG